jgi:hypothetical protein
MNLLKYILLGALLGIGIMSILAGWATLLTWVYHKYGSVASLLVSGTLMGIGLGSMIWGMSRKLS